MNEITKLANDIALDAATEVLESHTVTIESDGQKWHDVDTEIFGLPLGLALKREIRYLTLRGALVWHPNLPNLVRIVEVWS